MNDSALWCESTAGTHDKPRDTALILPAVALATAHSPGVADRQRGWADTNHLAC
jgi:hypothetical protein